MTFFIDGKPLKRRQQQLRHRHSPDRRGDSFRPTSVGLRFVNTRMARASPGSPFEGDWTPISKPNRPIPPGFRPFKSDCPRRRSFKYGETDNADSSAPSCSFRYRHESQTFSCHNLGSDNNHVNTSTGSDDAAVPLRLPAPDANFAELSRTFYKIIKLCHHLDHVAPADDDKIPSFIRNMMHHLCVMLKPAFPDSEICKTIKHNAQQWCSVTLTTLEQHYSNLLHDLLSDVAKILPEIWSSPFLVATRWAKKNFLNLHQSTLNRAKLLIQSHTMELRPPAAPDTAPPLHPPAAMDPPASPAVTAPQLSTDSLHLDPTPLLPHHPPSSTPPVGKTKKHRSSPKASTTALFAPPLPQRQDPRHQHDSTSGDDERPCSPALQLPKSQKVNKHLPLKRSDTGQLIPTDRKKTETSNTHHHDDKAEEPHTIRNIFFYIASKKKLYTSTDTLTHTTHIKSKKYKKH